MDSLGDAQAGGVAGCQNRPMLGAAYAVQKVEDLLRTQNHRQPLRLLRRRNGVVEAPVLLEGNLVEKSQGGNSDEDGARRQFPFVSQINLVGADVLGAQLFRRFIEVT